MEKRDLFLEFANLIKGPSVEQNYPNEANPFQEVDPKLATDSFSKICDTKCFEDCALHPLEDYKLLLAIYFFGPHWTRIQKSFFPYCTVSIIRNRWLRITESGKKGGFKKCKFCKKPLSQHICWEFVSLNPVFARLIEEEVLCKVRKDKKIYKFWIRHERAELISQQIPKSPNSPET